jgi:hypothetical protein
LLISPQDQRHSLSVWKLKDCSLDRSLKFHFQQGSIGSEVRLIFKRRIFGAGFRLERNMRVTLGTAQFVENQITRNFQ